MRAPAGRRLPKATEITHSQLPLKMAKPQNFLFSPALRYFWEGRWPENQIEPWRRLYDCLLVYVSEGSFSLLVKERKFRILKNFAVIIPPDVLHESRTLNGESTFRHCVHFDWIPGSAPEEKPIQCFVGEPYDRSLINPVPAEFAAFLPMIADLRRRPDVAEILETLFSYLRQGRQLSPMMLWPALNSLLMLQSDSFPRKSFQSKTSLSVMKIRDFINENYSERQDYGTYLRLVNLSGSHLCQAFTALMGRPPLAYLNDVRLQHARRLLRESSLGAKEIAEAVGIPDPNYFNRLFRRKFKTSPIRYRLEKLL